MGALQRGGKPVGYVVTEDSAAQAEALQLEECFQERAERDGAVRTDIIAVQAQPVWRRERCEVEAEPYCWSVHKFRSKKGIRHAKPQQGCRAAAALAATRHGCCRRVAREHGTALFVPRAVAHGLRPDSRK